MRRRGDFVRGIFLYLMNLKWREYVTGIHQPWLRNMIELNIFFIAARMLWKCLLAVGGLRLMGDWRAILTKIPFLFKMHLLIVLGLEIHLRTLTSNNKFYYFDVRMGFALGWSCPENESTNIQLKYPKHITIQHRFTCGQPNAAAIPG